jgi:hypothetical protein
MLPKTDRFGAGELEIARMNYESLSLLELKQLAKQRGYIKMYYVLPKSELVRILSLPEPPVEMKLSKMTIKQLRAEAKSRGLHGFWDLPRAELLALLYPNTGRDETASYKEQQNQSNTNEHDDPESHHSQ